MYPLHAHPLQIIADFDSSHLKANVSIVEVNPNQRVCIRTPYRRKRTRRSLVVIVWLSVCVSAAVWGEGDARVKVFLCICNLGTDIYTSYTNSL